MFLLLWSIMMYGVHPQNLLYLVIGGLWYLLMIALEWLGFICWNKKNEVLKIFQQFQRFLLIECFQRFLSLKLRCKLCLYLYHLPQYKCYHLESLVVLCLFIYIKTNAQSLILVLFVVFVWDIVCTRKGIVAMILLLDTYMQLWMSRSWNLTIFTLPHLPILPFRGTHQKKSRIGSRIVLHHQMKSLMIPWEMK